MSECFINIEVVKQGVFLTCLVQISVFFFGLLSAIHVVDDVIVNFCASQENLDQVPSLDMLLHHVVLTSDVSVISFAHLIAVVLVISKVSGFLVAHPVLICGNPILVMELRLVSHGERRLVLERVVHRPEHTCGL